MLDTDGKFTLVTLEATTKLFKFNSSCITVQCLESSTWPALVLKSGSNTVSERMCAKAKHA
eukprot:4449757-Karenia_brevis.AAC.1